MGITKLKKYQSKRDFTTTPEPKGKKSSSKKKLFVVQKHDSSHLHYDVRLAIDGVLVSWAVPKGPSTDPKMKRLAIRTEDHPLEYGSFEGIIPEGNYGAGTVMVWDTGTYKNITSHHEKPIAIGQALKNGHIEFLLEGEKLHGAYVLIKRGDDDKQWLLIKMKDEFASARSNPVSTQNKSALSGRTMLQIKKDSAHDKKHIWK